PRPASRSGCSATSAAASGWGWIARMAPARASSCSTAVPEEPPSTGSRSRSHEARTAPHRFLGPRGRVSIPIELTKDAAERARDLGRRRAGHGLEDEDDGRAQADASRRARAAIERRKLREAVARAGLR